MEAAMAVNGAETADKIKSLIYKTCLYQDDCEWENWLDFCSEDFNYYIRAYSPEIQKDMEYMGGPKEYMESITGQLRKHNIDDSPLKRHGVVYRVDVADDNKSATAVTSLTVFQTLLGGNSSHVDSGTTRIFLVGRYNDKFVIDGDDVKFIEREVRLDTRRLDKGTHWPI
jgi:methanesulfonate monooxygenase small subunit